MLDENNVDPLIDTNFNMRNKFVDRYTGEILPFRTPYNVEPDKGVENVSKDECVLSDYIPIAEQIRTFTREDIIAIKKLDFIEKELSDLDDDDLDDFVDSEDELETLSNLEELQQEFFERQDTSPQASIKATTSSTSEAKQADDASEASGGGAVSPSE